MPFCFIHFSHKNRATIGKIHPPLHIRFQEEFATIRQRRRLQSYGGAAVKAIKVFNNNAVSAMMPDGREAMVLGKGIGFGKRPGQTVDEKLIEKVYYVQTEMQTRFLQMLQNVQPCVIRAAEGILAAAEGEGLYMSSQATISLIDHISFAIERQEKGMSLPNLLLGETQMLYEKEYELGRRALEIIRDCCGITMPEDEAGYIALHLVSISVGRNTAYSILKFIKGALDIVKETYGIALDQSSMDTLRFTNHLKFLDQRIAQQEAGDEEEDPLYPYLLARDPRHPVCLNRLEAYIREATGCAIGAQEKFYLLIHLNRLSTHGE